MRAFGEFPQKAAILNLDVRIETKQMHQFIQINH